MDELPVMPLNTVLFPGMVLPLHIYEQRYRQLISWCQAEHQPFGVAFARAAGEEDTQPSPSTVGTAAIVARVDRLEDGRLNILAVGRERFRIRSVLREQPYLVCQSHEYPLVSSEQKDVEAISARLHGLLGSYMKFLPKVLGVSIHIDQLPVRGEALAWVAAATLQVDIEVRQRFLEQESLRDLLRQELSLLTVEHRLLQFIVDTQEAQDATDLTPFWHWSPN